MKNASVNMSAGRMINKEMILMDEAMIPALDSLIIVKQLPVIEEQLRTVKESVDARINDALCLACTEDTLKAVKAMRAQLNKEFKEFEERRKAVKIAVMKPLEGFDAAYKECVSIAYKDADAELKRRIESVERGLKDDKTERSKRTLTSTAKARTLTLSTSGTRGST